MNEYHLQFLDTMNQAGARFLIIGGQARALYADHSTRDLDVWVDWDHPLRQPLENALIAWAARYPSHTMQSMRPPLPLRSNVQIKFPDADRCLFLAASGEDKEIGPEDGIDVLTSVSDHDFSAFFERANWATVDGLHLPFVAKGDLDTISPQKDAERGRH